MGCLHSTQTAIPEIIINEHGFPAEIDPSEVAIATISYNRKSEKRQNTGVNAGMQNFYRKNSTTASGSKNGKKKERYTRQKPKRSRQSGRLTPSQMDFDNLSISSATSELGLISLDLAAMIESRKQWTFPIWGHHKECTICDHCCHDEKCNKNNGNKHRGVSKVSIRKQNNQKLAKDGMVGTCAMAFANLLAMVRFMFKCMDQDVVNSVNILLRCRSV